MLLKTDNFDVLLFHKKDAIWKRKRSGMAVIVPAENANGYLYNIEYFVGKGKRKVDWLHPVKITHRRSKSRQKRK